MIELFLRKIKFLVYLNFVCISISICNAQNLKNRFVLSGKVVGLDSGNICLSYINNKGVYIKDTALLASGKFSFAGYIIEPTSAILTGKTKTRSVDDPNSVEIFLEPSALTITLINGQFKNALLKGSHTNTDYYNLYQKKVPIFTLLKPIDSLREIIAKKLQTDSNSKMLNDQLDRIQSMYEPFNNELNLIDYKFIYKNDNSFISAYLLMYDFESMSIDSVKLFYNSLTPIVKNSYYAKNVLKRIQAKETNQKGNVAENFSVQELNGQILSLSEFRNKKVVLLDFWASWCVPCRKENPHLIELYKQFHQKGLEIISIANDDNNPKEWKDAINQDKIGMWHHILQGKNIKKINKGLLNKRDIGEMYGIQAIPIQILINKSGEIVGRYEGNCADLDKKLAEVIN